MNPIFYILLLGISVISVNYSFAQSDSNEQVTLSGDLTNNPVAQDILKKIEQTRKWIKEFADTYELDPYVQIVWNSDFSKYETAKRN